MRFVSPLSIVIWTITIVVVICSERLASAENPASETPAADSVAKFAAEDLEFFEQKIRPVLVKHCSDCHSEAAAKANKLKGGLRVDSREGLIRGGDSGPAVVPKDSDQSLLVKALRYESVEMPPEGKLSANVVADFERWISRGAADPRSEGVAAKNSKQIDLVEGRRHWSYQPLRHASIPDLQNSPVKPESPIDAFVLARLQSEKMKPAEEADRVTLIRRTFYDLVGLPPSPEEIDEFLTDNTADAFERLVDRLLASPHFGVRWGRHWLSVTRFGESLTLRGLVQPEAWRYRDYVIDSFNSDLPFNRFIVEQIAGDLLPAETLVDQQRQRIATSFLTIGNLNLEEQDKVQLRMDVVDEQLEAIGKGFLAQTIGCARCHDHKFDPIPTRDYYAMAGILANVKTLEDANVSKWLEFPLPLEPELEAVMSAHDDAVAAIQTKIKSVQEAQQKLKVPTAIAVKDLSGFVVDDRQAKIVGDWEHSTTVKPYVESGYIHDKNNGKGEKTVTFQPDLPKSGQYEVRFSYTHGDNRCEAVPITVFSAEGEKTVIVNEKHRPPIDGLFVSLGQFRFEQDGQAFAMVETKGTTGHVTVDAVQFLPIETIVGDPKTDKPADALAAINPDQLELERLANELKTLNKDLKQLQKTGPRRPKYMSVKEEPQTGDIRVHIRGTVHNLGDIVPRGFLQVASTSASSSIPSTQSGRKEFGEWIASPENPLTSRVIANRLWYWLYGSGLSRTPDNFGTTGDGPSHPELLDRIAVRLLEREWSLKPVIREIVTSRTFRQSSVPVQSQPVADPDNRWLSHYDRRRLDAESLLDAILTVSGQRRDELGGSTITDGLAEDYNYVHTSSRRAAYWPVFRNSLPEIFEAFDFADPSLPTGTRNVSTVAPQSLFFLNNRWVTNAAKHTAQRLLAEPLPDDAARIDRLFRLAVGRAPNQEEVRLASDIIARNHPSEEAWTMVTQALFASIDFRYVE